MAKELKKEQVSTEAEILLLDKSTPQKDTQKSFVENFICNYLIHCSDFELIEIQELIIDLLLINSKGVFVLESKNYAGWIFGNETQRNWTQVIYDSKKYFYNPIMQNNLHIKCLKKIIGESIPMHSIIAFSDKCTLKNVTIKNSNVNVANQREVVSVINQICEQINAVLLSETDVFNIYGKLYPYTQISREVKINHIANIQTS